MTFPRQGLVFLLGLWPAALAPLATPGLPAGSPMALSLP